MKEPKNRNATETQKKAYEAPELMIHGDIEEITQFLSNGPDDGDGGTSGTLL